MPCKLAAYCDGHLFFAAPPPSDLQNSKNSGHLAHNPKEPKMTAYDSIKNQYRALYLDMAFKTKGVWHVYKIAGRMLLLPEDKTLSIAPEVRNVQNMTETRLLAIMQELTCWQLKWQKLSSEVACQS